MKGYATSYNIEILNSELQTKDTESAIENKLKKILTEWRGFKFVPTLVLVLKNIENDAKTKYDIFYPQSNTKTAINESNTHDVFESMYTAVTVVSNIEKYLGKVWGWITDSVIDHNINISKHNALAGSSYIKLSKKVMPSKNMLSLAKYLKIITPKVLQKQIKIFPKNLILKT